MVKHNLKVEGEIPLSYGIANMGREGGGGGGGDSEDEMVREDYNRTGDD